MASSSFLEPIAVILPISNSSNIPYMNLKDPEPPSDQTRMSTVVSLLTSLVQIIPPDYDLEALTQKCFPLFLAFESYTFHTRPQRYQNWFTKREREFKELLIKGIPELSSIDDFVHQEIETFFLCAIQVLPSSPVCNHPTDPSLRSDQTKTERINTIVVQENKQEESFIYFSQLPNELKEIILKFVDNSNWKNCVRVSHEFACLFLKTRLSLNIKASTPTVQIKGICERSPSVKIMKIQSKVGSDELKSLPPKLQELELKDVESDIDDEALSRLSSLDLSTLKLEGPHIHQTFLRRVLLDEQDRLQQDQTTRDQTKEPTKRKWKDLSLTSLKIESKTFADILETLDLSEIQVLNISGNDFSKVDLKRIFNLPMKQLNHLVLTGIPLDKKSLTELCDQLGSQLRVLELSLCLVDHTDTETICQRMPQLELLNLSFSRDDPSFSINLPLINSLLQKI